VRGERETGGCDNGGFLVGEFLKRRVRVWSEVRLAGGCGCCW
jgi:hypothetical protein